MSIGLAQALNGVSRGTARRRAIDLEDDNREIALADRERRHTYEDEDRLTAAEQRERDKRIQDEDRGISVPVAKSNAEVTIAGNESRKQLLPGQTDNAMKQQAIDSGQLDYTAQSQDEVNALATNRRGLEVDQVNAERELLPGEVALRKTRNAADQEGAQFDLNTRTEKLMRADEVEKMQFETMQMENDLAKILQGPRTAEAEAQMGQTQNKIYGNIYQIAKTNPAVAAQMVNDVKSNGISDAANIVFADGKMQIVDANGQVLSDPNHGPAEFDINAMESAFGAKAEKGTFKVQDGVMFDTRNGQYMPVTDEDGKPIKDGDTAKLDRYIQNDIWKRAGDTFGSKLGDNFSFSGEGAQYATEAQTRAFQYYKDAGDGDLTTAWQRAFEEVQAVKIRDGYKNKLSGTSGAIANTDHTQIASDLESFFPSTDRNPIEVSGFMAKHGVKKIEDRVQVLKQMGYRVKEFEGQHVAEYEGVAYPVQ